VVPLKGGDDFLEGGVTSGNPNTSSLEEAKFE